MASPPRIRRGADMAANTAAADLPGLPGGASAPPIMHADDTMSPVDLPGGTTIGGRPLPWTSVAIYLAAAFLALTNATAIHGWAVELPPTAATARIVALAEQWEATADRLGTPRATVHRWWVMAQEARFGSERG